MRLPSEDRFAIVTTISRIEAKKVLEQRAEQGWKLIGFATRGNELVMVLERVFDRRMSSGTCLPGQKPLMGTLQICQAVLLYPLCVLWRRVRSLFWGKVEEATSFHIIEKSQKRKRKRNEK